MEWSIFLMKLRPTAISVATAKSFNICVCYALKSFKEPKAGEFELRALRAFWFFEKVCWEGHHFAQIIWKFAVVNSNFIIGPVNQLNNSQILLVTLGDLVFAQKECGHSGQLTFHVAFSNQMKKMS